MNNILPKSSRSFSPNGDPILIETSRRSGKTFYQILKQWKTDLLNSPISDPILAEFVIDGSYSKSLHTAASSSPQTLLPQFWRMNLYLKSVYENNQQQARARGNDPNKIKNIMFQVLPLSHHFVDTHIPIDSLQLDQILTDALGRDRHESLYTRIKEITTQGKNGKL